VADVLGLADNVYRWEGPKRKQTLFKAKLGRLVLVPSHLYFLSTGKNAVGRGIVGEIIPLGGVIPDATTDHLDLSALSEVGSLEIPVGRLEECHLHGMFKVMTVTYQDEAGDVAAVTFAEKNAGMPNGLAWVEAITQAKAALDEGA
jgi:hypothetical protein